LKVVFVKLGSESTPYLWLNIRRILQEQESIEITLIVNNLSRVPIDISNRIEIYHYVVSPKIDSILENLSHNFKFRNGFWRYSLERVFALLEYHLDNPNEELLHIESDVLILKNFPWNVVSKGGKIKWCRFNSERDIASLMFLPNVTESKWLMDELVQHVEKNLETTDMRALSEISHLHPCRVEIFPYFNSETQELLNSAAKNLDVELETSIFGDSLYDGIFDGAAIGMWLAGQDPHNHLGSIVYHDDRTLLQSESFVLPNRVRFHVSSNGELQIEYNGKLTSIYCLHIHSKQLSAFNEKSNNFINDIVDRRYTGEPIIVFNPEALFRLIKREIMNGTLLRFLYGVSPLFWMMSRIRQKARKFRVILMKE
jgi:hypothetical protein